jgi:uncharacterized protein YjlB
MSATDPQTLLLQPGDSMPNSRLPVLIYRGALEAEAANTAGEFDRLFARNGWGGIWRNGVYDFDHYHSNAHEALGVAQGKATLQLGGPGGEAVDVEAGDALVLPAGTGHRRISKSQNFVIIGAYPPGQEHYDICRERSPEAELRISKVKLPQTDPVRGKDGPLPRLWV